MTVSPLLEATLERDGPECLRNAVSPADPVRSWRSRSDAAAIDRIVILNDLSVASGGATGLALLSARLFRQRGIPVTYICGDDGASPDLAACGAEIVSLGGDHILTGNPRRTLLSGLHNAAAKGLVERWIAAHDTAGTIYHVHGWSKILSPSIFAALSSVAQRTVLHAHDYFLACPNGAFYNYPSQIVCGCRPLSGACLLSRCDRRSYAHKLWRAGRSARLRVALPPGALPSQVLLLHEKMAPFLQKSGYPAEALHVLRNPATPYGSERVRAEENRDFFLIGRLTPEKGIEDAIEAASRAGVGLTIIGEGPLRERIAARHADIRLLGWLDHDRMAAAVRSARALVMPTRYPEPFGLVAMEASLSGIPVLLSDKAYLAEEFVAAGIGLACDTMDPDAFAAAMRRLAAMPREEIRAMSERGYGRTARLSTTPEEWADGLLRHYAACLPKRDAAAATGTDPPRLRLFNVKYSPNLGDGLLSECLEKTLIALGADSDTRSIDLAGRRAYGQQMAARRQVLAALDRMPPWLRQPLVRLPLAVKARRSWRPHYARQLAGAHGVVIGGGNLFTDIDLNFPTKLALAITEAERLPLPFAIYATGVAQDWTPRGLAMMRKAVASPWLRAVFVRDGNSKRLWDENFGAASGREATVVRDPGLLAADFLPSSRMFKTARPVAGIGVMSHVAIRYHAERAPGRAHLEDWYADLAKGLVRRGFHVVAFTNGSPEDVAYLAALRPRMAAAGGEAISFPMQTTPDELCAIISSLDALVAYRMHAIIAAYSFRVPSVALAWDRKLASFMQSVGREEFLCDPAESDAEATADLLCRAMEEGIAADAHARVLAEAREGVELLMRSFRSADRLGKV